MRGAKQPHQKEWFLSHAVTEASGPGYYRCSPSNIIATRPNLLIEAGSNDFPWIGNRWVNR